MEVGPFAALQYILDNKGMINTEDSYPYYSVTIFSCLFPKMCPCTFNSSSQAIGATISSYKNVTSGDEGELVTTIATISPVSVAIDATEAFQFYQSGVFIDNNCTTHSLNHAVLAVGYDQNTAGDPTLPYYIVKNSWGTDWGMNGYIWMARNQNNMCGIATQASYVYI